jgi:hypothetical protein
MNRGSRWGDYVVGNRESLKKINETLDDMGLGSLYHYVDTIFDRIAASSDTTGPDICQKEVHQRFNAEFSKFKTNKALNCLSLLLLYHRMHLEWEISLRHDAVHMLYGALRQYYSAYASTKPEPEKAFVFRFLNVFEILCCGMRVENSLNANCPLGILEHCKNVEKVSSVALDPSHYDDDELIVVRWLENEIKDGKLYFDAVSQISEAVLFWLKNDPRWQAAAAAAKRTALEARSELVPTSYSFATELAAYMTTLDRITEFGEAAQCQAEFFKVIYCFPFVIQGFQPGDLGKTTRYIYESWKNWTATSKDGFTEAFKPTSFDEVELTDVWAIKSDHVDDDGAVETGTALTIYNLHSINFDNIVVHDVSDLGKQIRLSCEIRLSSFGNHYVRFYAAQGDQNDFIKFNQIDGHELHRILRRSSSLCGKEPISAKNGGYKNFPDDPYHPSCNLLGIAEKLIETFAALLKQKHGAQVTYDFAKTSRVIFSLAEFSPDSNTTAEEVANRETALRRIFMNPIGGPADRLEPWLSRSAPPIKAEDGGQAVPNLARGELGDGAHIYITANTAFIRLPSLAHFVCLDYEEMAEFVATIQPVYSDLTRRIGTTVKEALTLFDGNSPDSASELYLRLQRLAGLAQKTILDIDSPAIVTNSVYRDYLDDMIANSSARHWRDNLQQRTASVQEVVKGLAEHVRKVADDKTQHSRHVAGVIIAIAAVLISLGQLTDFKIYCREPTTAACWNYKDKDSTAAIPRGNPNSGAGQSQPVKTAP